MDGRYGGREGTAPRHVTAVTADARYGRARRQGTAPALAGRARVAPRTLAPFSRTAVHHCDHRHGALTSGGSSMPLQSASAVKKSAQPATGDNCRGVDGAAVSSGSKPPLAFCVASCSNCLPVGESLPSALCTAAVRADEGRGWLRKTARNSSGWSKWSTAACKSDSCATSLPARRRSAREESGKSQRRIREESEKRQRWCARAACEHSGGMRMRGRRGRCAWGQRHAQGRCHSIMGTGSTRADATGEAPAV